MGAGVLLDGSPMLPEGVSGDKDVTVYRRKM